MEIDLVYTWVDDAQPGFRARLERHARDPHDLNPNRTRDNLDLLRFSLRSVERFAPWVRNIHVVTPCRPPKWMRRDHPRLRLVTHEDLIPARHLPTFNSFAILTYLHRIPGISRRFLYLADDLCFFNPVAPTDFQDPHGRIRVFLQGKQTPVPGTVELRRDGPWNLSLAHTNALLDARYGATRRDYANHVPFLIDGAQYERMLASWPDEVARTRASRFRAPDNVPPPHLYPWWLLSERLGAPVSPRESARTVGYVGLGNLRLLTSYYIRRLERQQPKFCTFNDNFGPRPNPRVERMVARKLEEWFPEPSSFERLPRRARRGARAFVRAASDAA